MIRNIQIRGLRPDHVNLSVEVWDAEDGVWRIKYLGCEPERVFHYLSNLNYEFTKEPYSVQIQRLFDAIADDSGKWRNE